MMARNGEAPGFLAAAVGRSGSGPLHYILHRSVVLDKVEVGGCDGTQGHSQIANERYRFEKNSEKHHRIYIFVATT